MADKGNRAKSDVSAAASALSHTPYSSGCHLPRGHEGGYRPPLPYNGLLTDCALAISPVSNLPRRTMETWSVFAAMLPSRFANIINLLNCRRARNDAVLARAPL